MNCQMQRETRRLHIVSSGETGKEVQTYRRGRGGGATEGEGGLPCPAGRAVACRTSRGGRGGGP